MEKLKYNIRLIELCDRIRKDHFNAGYWLLLSKYKPEEIRKALDDLDKH